MSSTWVFVDGLGQDEYLEDDENEDNDGRGHQNRYHPYLGKNDASVTISRLNKG
jgi:hypothetical protein